MATFREAVRRLYRESAFFLTIVLVLGLGVGCATVGFGVVDVLVLRPLPFTDADRLVVLTETDARQQRRGGSLVALQEWRKRTEVFSGVAGYRLHDVNLTGTDRPTALLGASVTVDFFSVLGWPAKTGRVFHAAESDAPVVIVSHQFRNSRFGANSDVLGKQLPLGGRMRTIIGVLPADFRFLEYMPDVFLPLSDRSATTDSNVPVIVARVRKGVSLEEARAAALDQAHQVARTYPSVRSGWSAEIQSLHTRWMGSTRMPALMMFAAVGLMLLVACINAAGLLLARAVRLGPQIAIRYALGATRAGIAKLFLAEAALVSILGTFFGVAIAASGLRTLTAVLPSGVLNAVPGGADAFSMNIIVASFAAVIACVTAIGCSSVVLLQSNRDDALRTRGVTSSGREQRGRTLLLVAQVSVSVVLLASGGLLLKGYWSANRTELGFDPENLVSMWIGLSEDRHGHPAARVALYERVVEELRSHPGVESATAVDLLPSHEEQGLVGFSTGQVTGSDAPRAALRHVGDAYFPTLRIPLLRGRSFNTGDHSQTEPTAIISRSLETAHYGGAALDRYISIQGVKARIVGVAADVQAPLQRVGTLAVYRPFRQSPPLMTYFVARTRYPEQVAGAARRILWQLDPAQPIDGPWIVSTELSHRLAVHRFSSVLVGSFATCALLLATFGVYSVMTYAVASRRKEIGIRLALGSTPGGVRWFVLQRGLVLVMIGLGTGVLAQLFASSVLTPYLLDVSPHDVSIYGAVAGCVALAGLSACAFPAMRASAVDPASALRSE